MPFNGCWPRSDPPASDTRTACFDLFKRTHYRPSRRKALQVLYCPLCRMRINSAAACGRRAPRRETR